MKKRICILLVLLLLLLVSLSGLSDGFVLQNMNEVKPGDIIEVSCSTLYPTLSQPTFLVITVEGKAARRFEQTLTVTDEFTGFVAVEGEMTWVSGTILLSVVNITVGALPRYVKKIPWYPSIVGNHTFIVSTETSESKPLNISVGFDVEGIISPSLGHPSLLWKDSTSQLFVTLSEERPNADKPVEILQIELQDIFSPASYRVEHPPVSWYSWVTAGPDIIEDEVIVSYDIQSIPEGFYNLCLMTAKNNYSWPHAVRIWDSEPKDCIIVQLTDIHIGKYSNFVNKKKELIRLFSYMNEHIQPDFVILSGDSVDWYNQRASRNAYQELREALLTCNAPVFTLPGNHERYSNSLLFLYFPFTNLTGYHRFLNPLSDYSMTFGGAHFVFLDSGYEYSRWEVQPKIWYQTPEGSGLSSTQMYLLENHWGDANKNQVIVLHHPAVNDVNDTGFGALPNDLPSGNNECIAFNRAAFITYCLSNNVSLVLSGHTHENKVLNFIGKNPEDATAWPLFIQTQSATMNRRNNGGRVIQIKDELIVSYEYLPFR